MTSFLGQYGLFLAKTLTLVGALLVLVAGLLALRRSGRQPAGRLEIRNVNARLRDLGDSLQAELLPSAEFKKRTAERRKAGKRERRQNKNAPARARVFVLDFDGDLQASAVTSLREEVSAVLQVARDGDEVLLRLESGGGLVHAYGLAASQLVRLRQRQLRLTVAVDKVAASGGYMMACVADQVIAAPFAVVGSIGVVAQLPNFNRLLRRADIDLEQTHALFKSFVAENRPGLDLARVATGEHWFGTQALGLRLVDRLATSDDYLLSRVADADVYELQHQRKKPLAERLGDNLARLAAALQRAPHGLLQRPY